METEKEKAVQRLSGLDTEENRWKLERKKSGKLIYKGFKARCMMEYLEKRQKQVSEENTTVYLMDNLMDNLEVWKGLYELEHAGLKDVQAIREMRNKLQAQIEKLFWDDANQRWRIIENSDLYHQKEFYPDGVAQIYPLIYEFPVKEKKKQKILYKQFTERFQWQKLTKKRNGFLWAMTGMAAAQMGDINNLLEMIRNYEAEYCENRKYPLYTGEAGWICMECEKLYSLYERKIKTGFLV